MNELNKLAQIVQIQMDEVIRDLNRLSVKNNQTEYVHKLGELTAYNDVFRAVMAIMEGEE